MKALPVSFGLLLALTGCEESAVETPKRWTDGVPRREIIPPRWYDEGQVARGRALFQVHCAECHGADAAGATNWRDPGPDGKYPPPPLNGTGHAWHHPLSALRATVRHGGVPLGGAMPPFKDKLDDQEIDAILAGVQSHWSDEIYALWSDRNRQAGNRNKM